MRRRRRSFRARVQLTFPFEVTRVDVRRDSRGAASTTAANAASTTAAPARRRRRLRHRRLTAPDASPRRWTSRARPRSSRLENAPRYMTVLSHAPSSHQTNAWWFRAAPVIRGGVWRRTWRNLASPGACAVFRVSFSMISRLLSFLISLRYSSARDDATLVDRTHHHSVVSFDDVARQRRKRQVSCHQILGDQHKRGARRAAVASPWRGVRITVLCPGA